MPHIEIGQKSSLDPSEINDISHRAKKGDYTMSVAMLSFELEVVRIPNLNVVGIRRKKLKGMPGFTKEFVRRS